MTKKIIALLLCLMMVLSQSTLCFGEVLAIGEGAEQDETPVLSSITAEPATLNVPAFELDGAVETFIKNNVVVKAVYDDESTQTVAKTNYTLEIAENIATITYSDMTAQVTLADAAVNTDPIVLDFEENMGGMAPENHGSNVLDLSLENGALKCDYTYVEGERSYLYLPVNNIDGAFYDTIKVRAKVENVEGAPGNFVMYYTGAAKTDAAHLGESSARRKSFAYTDAVEAEGLYSNNDFVEYTIDMSAEENWKSVYTSKIRIDGLHNKSGIVYIDSIEIYNKRAHASKEPIVFEFENGLEGVTPSSTSGITAAAENGVLKGTISAYEKYLYVPFDEVDGSYYNTLQIRMKANSIQTTEKAQAKNAFFGFFYEGINKETGEKVNYAGGRKQKNVYLTGTTEQADQTYKSEDFVEYEIDYTQVDGWADTYVKTIRIDVLKNLYGEFEIDYIKLFHKEAAVLESIEATPDTISVPFANLADVKAYAEGAITGVTASYSDGTSAPVTGYEVSVEGNVATVTYEDKTATIALTFEADPEAPATEPLVFNFDDGLCGVTSSNNEKLTITAQDGKLVGETLDKEVYLYFPAKNIDGAYYDTLKLVVKADEITDSDTTLAKNASFNVFYEGVSKTTGAKLTLSSIRQKRIALTGLTEGEGGVWANADFVEYEIDLSALADWSDMWVGRLRIDPIKNLIGKFSIDSVEIYHKEEVQAPTLTGISAAPATITVPLANQADVLSFVKGAITAVTASYSDGTSAPVTGYAVTVENNVATVSYEGFTATIALTMEEAPATSDVPVWNFDTTAGGFRANNSTKLAVSVEDGALKCVTTAIDGELRNELGFNIDGAYYNRLKVVAKVAAATSDDANLYLGFFFKGTVKATGEELGISGARGKQIRLTGLTENEGVYSNSEAQTYILDLSQLNQWSEMNINYLRFDPLKNDLGTFYIDSIEFYHEDVVVPEITGISVTPSAITVPYENQGNVLDFVKGAITGVTASYDDGTSAPVTGYAVTVENNVATVSYEGFTATIALTMADAPVVTPTLTGISAAPSAIIVPFANKDNVLDFVKGAITSVTASYSDGTSAPVTGYAVTVENNVATVSYEGFTATIALTIEEAPVPSTDPIVWNFDENYTGLTAKNFGANVLTLSLEDGALKCDYNYTEGERSYIYVALNNIDGAHYNTLRIKSKIASVGTSTQMFRMFYTGKDKTSGEDYAENSNRYKTFTYRNLTENEGVYSNSDYEVYEIDLSQVGKWSDSYISRLRMDCINNASAVLYIDSIEIFHKDPVVLQGISVAPSAITVPYVNQNNVAAYVEGAITSVTASYSDGTSAPVTGYAVTVENNVATVSYEGFTATIALTMEEAPEVVPTLTGISAAPSAITVPFANKDNVLDYVKGAITSVTASYDDGTSATVTGYAVTVEGNVATVTYEGFTATIALTIEDAPVVRTAFEFEDGLDGVMASSNTGISIVAEGGKLKGTMTGDEKYLYVPVEGLDTSYYDGMKISIKVTKAVDTMVGSTPWLAKNAGFAFFYEGTDKSTGATVGFAGGRKQKTLNIADLTEQQDGSYANADFVEYIIDYTAIEGWANTNVTRVRIDPIRHLNGTFEIDYIRFYHKEIESIAVEPSALEVAEDEENVAAYVKNAITAVNATYNDGTTNVVTDYVVTVEGNIATVTYEGKTATIALTFVEDPALTPVKFDFTSGLSGITSSNPSKLTIAVQDGNLVGEVKDNEVYLYIPVNNVDGEYFNTFKMRVKVDEAKDFNDNLAKNASFNLFFEGTDKETGDSLGISSVRQKRIAVTDLAEGEGGVWANADYVEYVIDLSSSNNWSEMYVTRLRLDPLKNLLGKFSIDYIELCHTEVEIVSIEAAPSVIIVPLANQDNVAAYVESAVTGVNAIWSNGTKTAVTGYTVTVEGNVATVTYEGFTTTITVALEGEEIPEEPGEVAEGEEYIIYNFDEDVEGFQGESGVTVSHDSGMLVYTSVNKGTAEKAVTGNMSKAVEFDLGQYYKMEMKIRFFGVTPTLNASAAAPRLTMYFDGVGADGTSYTISSVRQATLTYPVAEKSEDGLYDCYDWQVVTLDLAKMTSWNLASIKKIRFDVLKDAEGVAEIDYIKFYSVPEISELKFDDSDVPATDVPVETEKITLTLSDAIYEIKANAVKVTSDDGVEVDVKSVVHEKSTNKVVITVGELQSMTNYTVTISSNALANEKQALYKSITKTFTTVKGELEVNATGDGNSAELAFENSGSGKNVVLIATIWNGDQYVGKVTEAYTIAEGSTTYTFNYAAVTGGNRAEITVWDYADGSVNAVYGKKVFTFDR